MFRIVDEPKNEAGMIAECAWCGGPVRGRGMGTIWLGSNRTYCSPKCKSEAEAAGR